MAKFELHTPEGNRLGLLTWQTGKPVSLDSDKNAPEENRRDLELALGIINRSSAGQIFYDLHERGFSKVYGRAVRIGGTIKPEVLAGILYKYSRVKLEATAL